MALGDRLGWRGIVATKLVDWWFDAKGGPERTTALRGAFERFCDVGGAISGNWAASSPSAGIPAKLTILTQKSNPRLPGSVCVMRLSVLSRSRPECRSRYW